MSCVKTVCATSCHGAKELRLQDKLPFLVFLAGLIRLVVLPAYSLFTLSAVYIAYDVTAGGHVALVRLRLGYVDDAVKEVGFAVLATKVLRCVSHQMDLGLS